MAEYGDIFDYELSATGFLWLNFGFMAAYGLFLACALPLASYLTNRCSPSISVSPLEV